MLHVYYTKCDISTVCDAMLLYIRTTIEVPYDTSSVVTPAECLTFCYSGRPNLMAESGWRSNRKMMTRGYSSITIVKCSLARKNLAHPVSALWGCEVNDEMTTACVVISTPPTPHPLAPSPRSHLKYHRREISAR